MLRSGAGELKKKDGKKAALRVKFGKGKGRMSDPLLEEGGDSLKKQLREWREEKWVPK